MEDTSEGDQTASQMSILQSSMDQMMIPCSSSEKSMLQHAKEDISIGNGKISTQKVYDNVIIGSGPGGINLAMEFAVRGIPYILLERSSKFGGQFKYFPRCGELISINKKHLPENNPGWMYARRYDWHTLSTITEEDSKRDPKLLFTNWTDNLFPEAKILAEYLEYVGNHPNWRIVDHSRFNCHVVCVTSDDFNRFVIETAAGDILLAQRVFMATGANRPIIPDTRGILEYGTFYRDFNPNDMERYRNKRVVIMGSGNSAFEVANALKAVAGDTFIVPRSVIKFARQTQNVHDVRTQSSVNYDLAQLKALTTFVSWRILEIAPEGGRLLLKTCLPQPHWETPVWRNRDVVADHVIVCCGFDYTMSHVFNTDRVRPQIDSTGKFCSLTATWESTNVPNLYFVGGSMRVNDRDAASGFIHGFRYNIQALGSVIAEHYYNQPMKPIFECVIDPECDDTFESLSNFITHMVSSTAALFELFNYGCSTITLEEISPLHNATTPRYKAEVWDVFPRDYARQKWANKNKYAGRVEIMFQYGFHLYGRHIPTEHFTHPADHFHPEWSAYIHPVLHAFRHDSENMDKFPDSPGKVEEWHMRETLLSRWDENDYKDECANQNQFRNTVYNAVAAALNIPNRKNTLPVHNEFIDKMYPRMSTDEVANALQKEPGIRLIAESKDTMLKSMPKFDTAYHPPKMQLK